MCSISIEITDHFASMKPLLAQLRRLDDLLPTTINLPAPPSVRERVSRVHDAMLAARARRHHAHKHNVDTSGILEEGSVASSHEQAVAKSKERLKERKQREEQTAALRIENMDRRDYDDDDEGPRRSGGGGGAKGADSAGSSATSKKRTANAADMGVDFGGDEDAAAGDMEEDDFFM